MHHRILVMGKKLLIVVDYQEDFVTGTLGFKAAEKISKNICSEIKKYRELKDGEIIFTFDTHREGYMNTIEGKNLPIMHCVENTPGWLLEKNIRGLLRESDKKFIKYTFGSIELGEYLKDREYESIQICGVVTNICVLSNAVIAKSALPEVPITISKSLVASNDTSLEEKAFDLMRNLHMNIVD